MRWSGGRMEIGGGLGGQTHILTAVFALVSLGVSLCLLGGLGTVKMSAVVLGRFFALGTSYDLSTGVHSETLLVESGLEEGR